MSGSIAGSNDGGFAKIASKMSGSITGSNDAVDSSLGDQFSTATYQTVSSCVQEVNQPKTKKEISDGYPRNMIGWSVSKKIGRLGIFGLVGVVESYDCKTKNFQVRYQNGRSETVPCSEIKSLKPRPPRKALPMGSRPLMMRASNAVPREPRCAGKGKKRARARNAPAKQSGTSSSAGGTGTADSGNDGANKRAKVQNTGKGKRTARALNASALHSGSSSAASEMTTVDSGNDRVNERSKVENAGRSTAARQAEKHQVQCSPRNN